MENRTGQPFAESSEMHLDPNSLSDCFQNLHHQDLTEVGPVGSSVSSQISPLFRELHLGILAKKKKKIQTGGTCQSYFLWHG